MNKLFTTRNDSRLYLEELHQIKSRSYKQKHLLATMDVQACFFNYFQVNPKKTEENSIKFQEDYFNTHTIKTLT